jgi:hypothetical protein
VSENEPKRFRIGRLEALLVVTVAALVFQVFPTLWFGLLWIVDVRNWSRSAWFGLNLAVILGLFAVRFGPTLIDDWGARRERLTTEREKHDKQQAAKEQREMLQRIKQGRRRRMY